MAGVGATWTRGHGVSLVRTEAARMLADAGLYRALQDGIDRGGTVEVPPFPAAAEWYEVRERGETAAVAVIQRDTPRLGQAALLGIAVAPAYRGRAIGTKAILVAERKLAAEGYAPLLVRVPRTNGRGLYFMLRTGFIPVPAPHRPDDPDDVTWFARPGALD